MSHVKHAKPDYEIHELVASRFSPYVYDSRPVSEADLKSLFEAARWAASSYNEQPWRYIVATKDQPEAYERLLSCLNEPNQAWAGAAPVLALAVVKDTFTHNDKPNGSAVHDVGAASATLTFEATSRGLVVHQMAGILPDRARELYNVPEGFRVITGLAIGYAGDPAASEELGSRDTTARTRRSLAELVFTDDWERPAFE